MLFFKKIKQTNKETHTHIKIVMRANNNVSISVLTDYTLGEKKRQKNHLHRTKKKYRYRILSFGRTNGVGVGRSGTPILLLDTLFRSKRGSREELVSFIMNCC